jgi:hypothetical protein
VSLPALVADAGADSARVKKILDGMVRDGLARRIGSKSFSVP